MEAILKFNMDEPEDRVEFNRATKAAKAYGALWDISQEIFRPARKHGYPDSNLNELIEKSGDYEDKEYGSLNIATEVISRLETKFYEILENNGVNLDEDYY